jgi:hypothetical protein
MAPDRAAAWACNCLWSGGGGDRDGRSTSGRWTNTGRRAVQTWSAACEVGCRHHPSRGRARPHLRVPRQCQGYRLASKSDHRDPRGSSHHPHRMITASRGVPVAPAPGLPVLVAGPRLRAGDPGQFRFRSRRGRAYGVTIAKVAGGVSSTLSSRWSAPRSPSCSTPSRPPPVGRVAAA